MYILFLLLQSYEFLIPLVLALIERRRIKSDIWFKQNLKAKRIEEQNKITKRERTRNREFG